MGDAAKVIEELGAVPVDKQRAPFLHRKVERIAWKAKVMKPLVYVIPDVNPNACAVALSGSDSAIAVTTGLLRLLDESEIEAVVAHEIGHILKGHSVAKTAVAAKAMGLNLAASIGGQMLMTSDLDFTPGDDDSDDFGSMMIKGMIATAAQAATASLTHQMQTALSFDSEFEADRCGGQLSKRPWALARALSKLEQFATQGGSAHKPEVSQLFIVAPMYANQSTHPPTNERIERLNAMSEQSPLVADLPTEFCSSCGEKTDTDGRFCNWCGRELDAAAR